MSGLEEIFTTVPDPRAGNASHRLADIILMMIAASLCGASNASEYSLFAKTRKPILNRLITYDDAPSHDTFSRVLRFMDPGAFHHSFKVFAAAFHRALSRHMAGDDDVSKVVAIDGKTLRRAYEKGCAAHPPMMVSAFAVDSLLCIGACAVKPGGNEVMAALEVVELLDLTGKIITSDALHCTRAMAQTVTKKAGDYVLALKGNRANWLKQAKQCFDSVSSKPVEIKQHNHGRKQLYYSQTVVAPTSLIDGHVAFGCITSCRGNDEPAVRYYMMSRAFNPHQLLTITKSHWAIENNLHWVLDMRMNEDQVRARKDHAPANTAIINRIARNILQVIDKAKIPISHRMKKCAWNDDYFINAITHMR